MRIRAHPSIAGWRERFELGNQLAVLVKQLFRLLRAHPILENLQLLGILLDVGQRNLVSAPETFEPVAAPLFRSAPSFRRLQHDHRPPRPAPHPGSPSVLPMASDLLAPTF